MPGHVRAGSEGWTFPSWEAGHSDALQRDSFQATTGDSECDPRESMPAYIRSANTSRHPRSPAQYCELSVLACVLVVLIPIIVTSDLKHVYRCCLAFPCNAMQVTLFL